MKRCPHCTATKGADNFYLSGGRLSSWCKQCTRQRQRDHWADPEMRRRLQERQRSYAGRYSARTKARYAAERREMIEAYGGACACCGESHHEFLTIDHIDGDGAAERRENAMVGAKIARVLRERGWPKDRYRLLCFNCNCSLGIRGYCPHQP